MNTSATAKMIDRPCHSYKHVKKKRNFFAEAEPALH